jgi:hypothetical protein
MADNPVPPTPMTSVFCGISNLSGLWKPARDAISVDDRNRWAIRLITRAEGHYILCPELRGGCFARSAGQWYLDSTRMARRWDAVYPAAPRLSAPRYHGGTWQLEQFSYTIWESL